MVSYRSIFRIAGLLLYLFILPSAAQPNAPEVLGTIKSQQLAAFPFPLEMQLESQDSSELNPELLQLVNSILSEQGVIISNKSPFALFVERIKTPSKSIKKPPVAVVLEGGNRKMEKAQIELSLDVGKKKAATKESPQPYGFEGRVEGPAGITYWKFTVTSKTTEEGKRLTDARLLQEAFAEFSKTTERVLHEDAQ
ncbi:hypothetical protein [Motiliproteus sp. MSK22-1]|uniref:hypothetical protein n=1 Tax=Motiliproteus sp. MSK22-1 TaxID=1897630 RepID=UPI00097750EA|nr:hypothetical protein [Motiliproteus sp. MSK22-1]OMH26267.1 hypothetical protein BGP75_01160 [Motiliproteus sp. MSK22-1]